MGAASFARSARADEAAKDPTAPFDYVVHKGDTCTSVALKLFGDAKRVDVLHAANPQLGPQPHHLTEGMVLHIRAVPDARVSFVRNQVEAFTPDEHGARRDEPLRRGHRVDTEADSSAEVTFADETRLQLGEHTLVVILGARGGAAKVATDADTTLLHGTLRAHLAELAATAAPLAVDAGPGHKVLVDGGSDVLLGVDEAETARLAVHRGKSRLRASGKEVAVPEGFGSKAEKGKPPTPPRPLPSAPSWATPFPPLLLAAKVPVDAAATYAPGSGAGPAAAEWHVQLARDDRFNDLVVDARVPVAVSTLEAKSLAAGGYYARVSAIDADHFEGKPGPVAAMTVVVPKETSAPTGQRGAIDVPATLFCAIDAEPWPSSPGKPITISRARPHRLRCATSADGAGAAETTLAAQSIGEVHVAASLHPSDAGRRTGRLTLTVTDAEGAPVSGAALRATGTNGATIGEIVESGTPGIYDATVEWASLHAPFRASVKVNGLDAAESNEITPAEDRAPAAPTARERSPYDGEVAVLAGFGATGDGLGRGPAASIEAGARRELGPASVALALRLRYEHYERGGTGTCTPTATPLAAPCTNGAESSAYPYTLDEHLVTFELPITARLGERGSLILPYVGVAPGIVIDHSIVSASSQSQSLSDAETRGRFSFHAFAGTQVRVGPGGFFLEAGYRVSPVTHTPEGDSHLESFLGELGYSFSL